MTNEEKRLMSQYGITQTNKTIFSYKHYKYENLKDAINFAENDRKRQHRELIPGAEWIAPNPVNNYLQLRFLNIVSQPTFKLNHKAIHCRFQFLIGMVHVREASWIAR